MNSRFFALLLISGVLLGTGNATLQGGQVKRDAIPNKGIFGISVRGGTQEFYARADQVLSVAIQEYTTGPFIVNEVTVDMGGANQLLRIYTTRPQSATQALQRADAVSQSVRTPGGVTTGPSLSSSLPSNLSNELSTFEKQTQGVSEAITDGMVVKVWPTGTNAKTVEFSVGSLSELHTFYSNFRDLLIGRPVSVKSDGGTFSQAELASGAAQQPGTAVINRIGGTLFVIE